MARKIASVGLLACACLAAGCSPTAWSWPGQSSRGRTVTAQSLRDPNAALRENEAGLALLAKGDLDQARAAFLRALAADAEFGPAENNLGKVSLMQGDLHEAARRFDEARRLMPRHAGPCNNLGLVYEEAWRRKTSPQPGSGQVSFDARSELNRAIEQYRAAIILDAGSIEYRANLVRALVHRGDRTDEVRSLLKQVMEQDTRPQWQTWARRQWTALGRESE
jgi:Flp pilus assembly protein TadD